MPQYKFDLIYAPRTRNMALIAIVTDDNTHDKLTEKMTYVYTCQFQSIGY